MHFISWFISCTLLFESFFSVCIVAFIACVGGCEWMLMKWKEKKQAACIVSLITFSSFARSKHIHHFGRRRVKWRNTAQFFPCTRYRANIIKISNNGNIKSIKRYVKMLLFFLYLSLFCFFVIVFCHLFCFIRLFKCHGFSTDFNGNIDQWGIGDGACVRHHRNKPLNAHSLWKWRTTRQGKNQFEKPILHAHVCIHCQSAHLPASHFLLCQQNY